MIESQFKAEEFFEEALMIKLYIPEGMCVYEIFGCEDAGANIDDSNHRLDSETSYLFMLN
jgi:hypothetical protein